MKSEKKHEQLRPRKKNIARKTKKLATPRKAQKAQSRASVKTPKSTGSGSSSATKKLNRKLPRKIKRISSKPRPKAKQAAPRNEAQYSAKSEKFKDSWDRVLTVVSKMRSEKVSLTKASQDVGISPRTVIRLGRSAFRKRKNGKYAAKAKDNLLRLVMVPTPEGTREIAVRGSEQVRLLAEYWNALHRYLQTGDATKLKNFEGKRITDASGVDISLSVDLTALNHLGSAGVLSFESLYARST